MQKCKAFLLYLFYGNKADHKNFSKMNEQTTKLLRDLAEKLGTTVENLFTILVNHAHISALFSIFQVFIWLTVLFAVRIYYVKCNHLFTVKDKESYSNNDITVFGFAFVVTLIIALIAVFMIIGCARNGINGFLDPRFWALEQVTDMIRH